MEKLEEPGEGVMLGSRRPIAFDFGLKVGKRGGEEVEPLKEEKEESETRRS